MRRALVVLPAVALLGVLGIGLFRTRATLVVGSPAPPFALRTLDGERRIGSADLRGSPAVVNFWASWCEPCKDEAPELVRAHADHGGDVRFLGVSILDGREEAAAFAARYGIPYPSVRDPSGSVSRRYGVTGVPETVFVDRDGRVVGVFIGAFPAGRLDEIMRDLVTLKPGALLNITGRGETRPVP